MPTDLYRSPVPSQLWDAIRDEFGLPTLDHVRVRFESASPNAEPTLRQLVRVFIDDGTFCPGFQFQTDISLNPVIADLFQRAMQLRIPHNYFALWMMTPCNALDGIRPVDRRKKQHQAELLSAVESSLARAVA